MDDIDRKKKVFSILKFVLLLIILIGIPAYLVLTNLDGLRQLNNMEDALAILKDYGSGTAAVVVYIIVQILQIIISVIPGQPFQIAAGYMFGFFPSLLYSVIGAMAGTMLSFVLAKFLGKDALHIFFKEEQVERYVHIMNSKGAYIVVFLLYLIPGLPKDILSYAAGVSDMKFKIFIPISTIARTPAMAVSIMVGALYDSGNFTALYILIGAMIVIAGLCLIFNKRLRGFLNRFYSANVTE